MATKAAEQKQLQSVEETEADSIRTSHALDEMVTPAPKRIKMIHVDSAVGSQTVEPDQKTTILIYQVNQTDTHAGEYFGATLYTYNRPPGEQFEYQHLLKNIKDRYPAQTMKIREGDELVWIGHTFTSDLDHTEVLNSFLQEVRVDGKSRFCLGLKRSEDEFWNKTCAILTPNHDNPNSEFPPITTILKFGHAKIRTFRTQKIRFSIENTMAYMFIDKTGISGEPMKQSHYVNFTSSMTVNQPATASLCGMDGQSYVRIDGQRNIVISDKSNRTCFHYTKKGHDYKFNVHDFFLSYDKKVKSFAMSNSSSQDKSIIYIGV